MTPFFSARVSALLLAALCSALVPAAAAQARDSSYGSRALVRFVSRVRTDDRLPARLRDMTLERLDALPVHYFALLDDSSATLWLQTLAAILEKLPEPACGAVLSPSAENTLKLSTLIASADSATVDAVLRVHERVLVAIAKPVPLPIATREETGSTIGRLMAELPPADYQRFVHIAQTPPPNEGDACWAARTLYRQLATLPPPQLGPVFRAMSQPPRANE
jgi:hypothetical protein